MAINTGRTKNRYLSNLFALEKGASFFRLGNMERSAMEFEAIQWDPDNPDLFYLRQIYLVKIYYNQKQFSAALQLLKT